MRQLSWLGQNRLARVEGVCTLAGERFGGIAPGARLDVVTRQGNRRQILRGIRPRELDSDGCEIWRIAREKMPDRQQDNGDGSHMPQGCRGERAAGELALNPLDA